MIEQLEIKKYDNFPFKSKWKNIKFLNRWGLVASGSLTVITLLITWIFFISVYRSNVDQLLADISSNGFKIDFIGLSLSMFVFMLMFISFLALYFIFFKKYDVISIVIVVICLGFSGLLLIFMIIFAGIANSGFREYITKSGVSSILFFAIPWAFTVIFAGSAIGFSSWIIIDFFPKKLKSVFLNQQSIIEQERLESSNELVQKLESKSILLSPVDQQSTVDSSSNKRFIYKKHDDEPNFQALENIRLQVQPGAVRAVLPEALNSEVIAPKIKETLDEHNIKPKFNPKSSVIKNKEKAIPALSENKRIIVSESKMITLKAEVSQPLHKDESKICAKDVTLTVYQTTNPEIAPVVTNSQTQDSTEQLPTNLSAINPPTLSTTTCKLSESHDSANLKIFSNHDSPVTVQKEQSSSKFVQNIYPTKAPVQGVPPSPIYQEPKILISSPIAPVLTTQISQPINPQPPEPEPPKKPTVPLKIWTNEQINRAWVRGLEVPTYELEAYRSDYAGALMFKSSFVANPSLEDNNNVRSYSWTIVYQRPLSAGGTEETSNLWPLNCMNALAKGQDYPRWKTTVTFDGRENVFKDKKWKGKRKLPKIKT